MCGGEGPCRVDVHTHILPRDLDLCRAFDEDGYITLEHKDDGKTWMVNARDGKLFRVVEPNCFDVDVRLKEMDEQGITIQVLSVVPVMFSYWATIKDDAVKLARYINDDIAAAVKKHPTRFIGLGTIPLQFPDEAVIELRRCMELGLAGVEIGTHVNKWELSSQQLWPIFEEAERLGAAIFVHPWDMLGSDLNKFWLPWLVGMPAETTRAIAHCVYSGLFDKFPRLRMCFAHGGGSFCFSLGRLDWGWWCREDLCAMENPEYSPSSYVKQKEVPEKNSVADLYSDMYGKDRVQPVNENRQGRFWVDSLTHDIRALDYLIEIMGEDRICLGSDYPFPLGEPVAGNLILASKLPEEVKQKILSGNPLTFLGAKLDEATGKITWNRE